MLRDDGTGRCLLEYEVTGRIRRVPLPLMGTSRRGIEWRMGSVVLEVVEEGVNGSAELYLVTFDDELTEMIDVIGVGKDVKARFHIETRAYFDSYKVSCILDSIEGCTDGEDRLYNTKRKNGKDAE